MSACDCISKVDAMLAAAGHNTRVERLMQFLPTVRESDALVRTVVDKPKRGARATTLTASYCPFCGVKYCGDAS